MVDIFFKTRQPIAFLRVDFEFSCSMSQWQHDSICIWYTQHQPKKQCTGSNNTHRKHSHYKYVTNAVILTTASMCCFETNWKIALTIVITLLYRNSWCCNCCIYQVFVLVMLWLRRHNISWLRLLRYQLGSWCLSFKLCGSDPECRLLGLPLSRSWNGQVRHHRKFGTFCSLAMISCEHGGDQSHVVSVVEENLVDFLWWHLPMPWPAQEAKAWAKDKFLVAEAVLFELLSDHWDGDCANR